MDHARKTPNSKHLDLKKGMTKLTIFTIPFLMTCCKVQGHQVTWQRCHYHFGILQQNTRSTINATAIITFINKVEWNSFKEQIIILFQNIAKRRWQWMLITKHTYLSKNAILKFIDFIKLWKSLSLKLKEGQIGLNVHCKIVCLVICMSFSTMFKWQFILSFTLSTVIS